MKQDLTKSVMDRVISLERQQVRQWRIMFWAVVGILLIIVLILLVQAWQIIQDRGTFDLLTLFQEDQDVIAEFWQDTLTTFWEELPQRRLFLTAIVGVIIGGVFLATKKTRRVLRKKLEQLQEYTQ